MKAFTNRKNFGALTNNQAEVEQIERAGII